MGRASASPLARSGARLRGAGPCSPRNASPMRVRWGLAHRARPPAVGGRDVSMTGVNLAVSEAAHRQGTSLAQEATLLCSPWQFFRVLAVSHHVRRAFGLSHGLGLGDNSSCVRLQEGAEVTASPPRLGFLGRRDAETKTRES